MVIRVGELSFSGCDCVYLSVCAFVFVCVCPVCQSFWLCVCVYVYGYLLFLLLCVYVWVGLWVCVFLTECFFVRNISDLHSLL